MLPMQPGRGGNRKKGVYMVFGKMENGHPRKEIFILEHDDRQKLYSALMHTSKAPKGNNEDINKRETTAKNRKP